MPNLRFRGVRTPTGNCRELVKFDDRDSPCYTGFNRVFAEAYRVAESRFQDPSQVAACVDELMATAQYDGLNHVGGVCFVDLPILRPQDEVIDTDTFIAEKQRILAANNAALASRVAATQAANNPQGRALPEHEGLRWRTRFVVASHAELQHHTAYRVGDFGFAYMRMRDPELPDGTLIQLIDIYHDGGETVEEGLVEGRDAAELMADLLALSAYAPADVIDVIGTSPTKWSVGQSIEVATFSVNSRNSPVRVLPQTFEGLRSAAKLEALHSVRIGLTAMSPAHSFAAFWNAAEQIAHKTAKANKWHRITKCKVCETEANAGLDLRRAFAKIYETARFGSELFDQHRQLRGKIQHGAASDRIKEQREIELQLGLVRAAATTAAVLDSGVQPQTADRMSVERWPVIVWTCNAKEGGTAQVTFSRAKIEFAAGGLPAAICGDEERGAFAGCSYQMLPNTLILPPFD